MESAEVFVGIDVSKATLDVFVLPGNKAWTVPNEKSGIKGLVKRLKSLAPERIVMEATGVFHVMVAAELAGVGLPVVVRNPRHVKNFAKSVGTLAKTDRIDAKVLAEYGRSVRPDLIPLKDEETRELDALVSRRNQLVEMRKAEKKRLCTASKRVRPDIEVHITWLTKRIKESDKDIRTLIESTSMWKGKDKIIQSVPGAGPAV